MRKPRPISTQNGHVNHAMSSSADGSIYATADGYETPITHVYREQKPQQRIIGDVILAVRNSPPNEADHYGFKPRNGNGVSLLFCCST
ncbi:unnamed protein product [Strongylus vulgaris]|uniref:Uncharacterized protein n=1 Tax=Strongylus vulgaris TaxID=40348 RepID=A0A3P7JBX5_STRVU|nr:unnamed protein product [Strongylus vulgaris]